MKQFCRAALALALLAACPARAADDRDLNKTLDSSVSSAAYTVAVNAQGQVGFSISGLTASGATLTPECSNNSQAASPIWSGCVAISGSTLFSTLTADGSYRIEAGGRTAVRLRVTSTGSGTITISSNASAAPSLVTLAQALPAGSNMIGSVSAATQGYKCSVSTTRPNDTNALTANDVIGSSTSASGAVWSFSSCGPSAGGEIMLTSAELEIDASAIISGETSYNLYLYNVTVPSALGDNAAFDIPSGDRASFLGKVSLGTPVDEGSTLYVRTDTINAQFTAPSGGALFGYLVTVGGYTPTAQRVYKVTLHFVGM